MTTSTIAHGGVAARTAAFRAAYRAQIAPLYNGLGHVLLIYLIGGAALWYCIQQIHRPTWVEWLIVPVTVVGANIFEWFLHLQVMHRPRPGLMDIYKRHTLAHHQFFTEREPFQIHEGLSRRIFSAIRPDCLPRHGRRPRVCGCHDLVV